MMPDGCHPPQSYLEYMSVSEIRVGRRYERVIHSGEIGLTNKFQMRAL